MKVSILCPEDDPRKVRGTAVVIDVIRASSHITTMFARGIESVVPAPSIDAARELKARHPGHLLFGEEHRVAPRGFDYGNSPTQTSRLDLRGRNAILATTNGTRVLAAVAPHAKETWIGSFLNAGAVVKRLAQEKPDHVTFVPAGNKATGPQIEDDRCARYLAEALAGDPPYFPALAEKIKAERLAEPRLPSWFIADVDYCLGLSKHDVVPKTASDLTFSTIITNQP